MARSTYVYIVQKGSKPVAGFTVKHELGRWLIRQENLAELGVWRARDGRPAEPVTRMLVQEILDEAARAILR